MAGAFGAQILGVVPFLSVFVSLMTAPLAGMVEMGDLLKVYVTFFLLWTCININAYAASFGFYMPLVQNYLLSLGGEFPDVAPLINVGIAVMPVCFWALVFPLAILEGIFTAFMAKLESCLLPKRLKIRQVGF